MFYDEMRIKQGLSYISFCPLRSHYNSKVILLQHLWEQNAIVVTSVQCSNGYFHILIRFFKDDQYFYSFAIKSV